MTDSKAQADLTQEIDDSCLVVGLATGPRKSGVVAQFMGRINRRNSPSPTTVFLQAPTGKAHAQLQRQLGQSSQGEEVQKMDEELGPGILKP